MWPFRRKSPRLSLDDFASAVRQGQLYEQARHAYRRPMGFLNMGGGCSKCGAPGSDMEAEYEPEVPMAKWVDWKLRTDALSLPPICPVDDPHPERMKRMCARCGFVWYERPADHETEPTPADPFAMPYDETMEFAQEVLDFGIEVGKRQAEGRPIFREEGKEPDPARTPYPGDGRTEV